MSSRGRSNKGSNEGGNECGVIGGVQVVVTDETIEPEASFPGKSCRVCRKKDTDEMVRCDQCLKWFHFDCVGVCQDIESKPWKCLNCVKLQLVPEPASNEGNTLSASGGSKKKATTGDQLPANIHPSDVQTSKKKQGAKGKVQASEPPTQVKAQPTVKESKAGNAKAKSVVSHASSRSSQALAKLKLQKLEEERTLNEKKWEQERIYLEEKYKLMEEMASEAGSNASIVSDPVKKWLPQAQSSHRSQQENPQSPVHESHHSAADPPGIPSDNHQSKQQSDGKRSSHRENHSPERGEDQDLCSLTRKQLAARQAVSKELPQFSGNPEDWPLFIATFHNTTAMCGFTNEENIFRLQKSLRGRAFEVVKSRLVHPANVPGVLKTLKMMFGQPEAIVHSLIEKIHSLPPIREDRLETLVDFAVSVENFCATVDACGLDEQDSPTSACEQVTSDNQAELGAVQDFTTGGQLSSFQFVDLLPRGSR